LVERYGVRLIVTGVAELGGSILDLNGLHLPDVCAALDAAVPIARMAGVGRSGMASEEMIRKSGADIVLEATPANPRDGTPGLPNTLCAIESGIHVVLANKSPLVLRYDDLRRRCNMGLQIGQRARRDGRPCLRFSATVGGALPTLNLGTRDLRGSHISSVEAVLNGTSQYILRMMETGASFPKTLEDTQRRGIAESDASLDISGYDSAAKLVILANTLFGLSLSLTDVKMSGIDGISTRALRAALERGERVVPLCRLEPADTSDKSRRSERYSASTWRLFVGPASLPQSHPLARLEPDEMGVVYYSPYVDRLSAASSEHGPEPAAAAMLRDVLDIIDQVR